MRDDGMFPEPPRLRDTGAEELRGALSGARAEGPSARRLAAIASGLPVGLSAGMAAAAFGGKVKLLVALTAAITAGGVSAWYVRRTPPVVPKAEPAPRPRPRPAVVPLTARTTPASAPASGPAEATPAPARRRPPARPHLPLPAAPIPASAAVEAPSSVAPVEVSPAPPLPRVDVAAETQLLDAARRALRTHPAETSRLATEHERRFPEGLLAQEREVIAIEALVALGAAGEARGRAEAFGRRFPRSAHLRRIAALLERGGPAR